MNGFLFEIETIIENQSISLIKKSVKIPLSKNLTFTQYKNDYALLLENYLKQYVDNTEHTFIKQQLFSFNEYLSFMVNGTMTKTKIQMLLEDLEQPKTLDDLKQSTEQKIEFLEDKLKEVSNNKAPQQIQQKTENNPFPLMFVNENVYSCFLDYKKHIIEVHTDYSYLKKRLENLKLIHKHTDNDFMNFLLNDIKFITKKDFENYTYKYESKLKSLAKSYSEQRCNNFNIVFESLI
jgi:glutaredoxin